MTPYDHSAEENVNDAAIRAGMKSLEGKYPVTVRYEKFDRAPYDPEAAVAEFENLFVWGVLGHDPRATGKNGEVLKNYTECGNYFRAALLAAHAAGIEEAARWLDDWGSRTMAKTYAKELRGAARADGVAL